MKRSIIASVILMLVVTAEVRAEDQVKVQLRPLYETFGLDSTTKVEIVSGPEDVQMRNGRVAGRQWIARGPLAGSEKHRFKITIEIVTGVELDQVVRRIENLPGPYMKALTAVSDEGEDGLAIYASLGGARAHGGKGYINLIPRADALVIAHEAGHTLEQVYAQSDPKLTAKWDAAIMADKISISDYGDHARSEDLAEFAQVYAVCLGAGSRHLATLKNLSPSRFALWEKALGYASPLVKAKPPQTKELTIELGGGVTMQLLRIEAGEFMMGSHESPRVVVDELGMPEIFVEYLKNELPQHCVRITKPFYLAKYEVTQEQWKAVMGTAPSFHAGPKLPVESVSWNDCQAFMQKLNQKTANAGICFSLPTEAQWEYASRAGTTTRFSFGNDAKTLKEYAWYGRNSGMKTQPVGLKKPNPWGLYDMHGNVHEWCTDWHDSDYYQDSSSSSKSQATTDPIGPAVGGARVLRGGSFYDYLPDYFRCSDRYHDHPGFHYYRYGLRPAGNILESK
jgi:formylglycine-generating enzyme required for sulfatase activity